MKSTRRERPPRATPPRPKSGDPGAMLRRERQARRWTQLDLAGRTGLSVPYVSMLENGKRPITVAVEPILREALGLAAPLPVVVDRPPVPDGTPARLGAILVSSEHVALGAVARVLRLSIGEVRRELVALSEGLAQYGMAVLDDGVHARLAYARDLQELVGQFVHPRRRRRLSMQSMEVLAVAIAEGAITVKQIDDMRGVESKGLLANLVTNGFLWVNHDESAPGRPNVYRPTLQVLEVFGQGATTIEELREVLMPTPQPADLEPPTEEVP